MLCAQLVVTGAELGKKDGKEETIVMIAFAQILPKSDYVVSVSAY